MHVPTGLHASLSHLAGKHMGKTLRLGNADPNTSKSTLLVGCASPQVVHRVPITPAAMLVCNTRQLICMLPFVIHQLLTL